MGSNIYLSLECPEAGEEALVRKVNEGYLSNTFSDALDYLLEENNSYNANQINTIKQIKGFYEQQIANPNSVGIEFGVYDKDSTIENPRKVEGIELENIIADYSSRILQPLTEIDENGQELKSWNIEMYLASTGPGGN